MGLTVISLINIKKLGISAAEDRYEDQRGHRRPSMSSFVAYVGGAGRRGRPLLHTWEVAGRALYGEVTDDQSGRVPALSSRRAPPQPSRGERRLSNLRLAPARSSQGEPSSPFYFIVGTML